MKIFSLFIRILLAITPVFTAAESLPDSVVGTYYVTYYPGQSAGKLHSCSLVYSAMLADHAYKNGGLVNINGNIGLRYLKNQLFFSIKIGFKDLDIVNSDFSPPNFAYIQTPLGSSVRSNGISQQGDTGYLLYLTPMDEALFATTAEMLNTGKVTVGFNRKKDGLDVLVPLDLRVAESQVDNYGNVSREMSDESIIQFLGCYKKLMERWVAQ